MAKSPIEPVCPLGLLVATAGELVVGGLEVLAGVVELGRDVLVEVLDLELGFGELVRGDGTVAVPEVFLQCLDGGFHPGADGVEDGFGLESARDPPLCGVQGVGAVASLAFRVAGELLAEV